MKLLCRTFTEKLAHQQDRRISALVPRAEHFAHECLPSRARSAHPARVTLSRAAAPAITAPALPSPPRETSRAAGGRRDMHAQLRPERQAGPTGPSRTSSVVGPPVRGRPCKADGSPHRSQVPNFVRYASVDPATQRSTARRGDTRRDREETP